MAYQMKNINSANAATLNKITNDLEKGILSAIEETKYLQNALGLFKSSLDSYKDNALEKSDIICKYKRNTSPQSFNLPGIMASSIGQIDSSILVQDNQRLQELTNSEDALRSQKDINYSIMISNTNDLISKVNSIKASAMFLENFILQMENANS